MNFLKSCFVCLLLLVPSVSWSQTQAVDLPIQTFTWSADWTQGGTGTPVPHHYDFVCTKTGVTASIRKPLALLPAGVDFTTLFTVADVGSFLCHAEAMTVANVLIVSSLNTIGFDLFVFQPPAPAPSELRMRMRVR